ncbi:DNA glycosylase AlkZ-like family protein [Motilibacter aurantiacus]|uniref:DNA glycosylase AlkZ-like family protein n=1 Tax=Motilibacter aurantiacus TaxID=2714955 RepID=UPI00140C6ED4|nr:crosslink repair DNA glycosylase YcaQ family protein [Motilibacter aurantiacus]NHC46423.1 winged helix DNA-binding domain-containing protein [Motilibacter aurantiacus]
MGSSVSRSDVLAFRARAQQLDREAGAVADTAVLDIGVQDTGPDGGLWALALRGVDVARPAPPELATLWTVRGAPHLYRRKDLAGVAAAVAPYSEADAAKRVYDAAKPLKAAGIAITDALDEVAAVMRRTVTEPTVKGEVSSALTAALPEPYLRFCRPCNATHLYEQPFRLAAVRAGLELEPGTSPPVLRRIPGFRAAATVPERLDLVRGYLRLLGPATPKHVADYLDAPVREVQARWPDDATEVDVAGERRWVLADDVPALGGGPARGARLLGPFDLFLQAKDRALLVDDPARSKALWPVLGRPGALLLDGDLAGTWRPRTSGKRLRVALAPWGRLPATRRAEVEQAAERLAAYRGVQLAGVDLAE